MPNSASKKLSIVKEIIDEGKMEDALAIIKDIEQLNNLTPEEMLKTLYCKADLYLMLGKNEIGIKIAEELYHKGQEMNMPLFSLDGLFVKGRFFIGLGRFEEYYKIIEQQDTLFHSIPREDSLEYQKREAKVWLVKGFGNMFKGNYDLSLDYYDKSLTLLERFDPPSSFIPILLWARASAYQAKGELNLSIEDNEKAFSLFPEGEYYLLWKGNINRTMGSIYKEKGDLNKALEHHVSGLNNPAAGWAKALSYLNIIELLLVKKDTNQARNYQEQFKRFEENYENRVVNLMYQLARALILKSSSRMRDRVEAETILKKIIENKFYSEVTTLALINLCDWYFEEFRLSNQMDILEDIIPLIDHLHRNARQQNSFSSLANVKLLQAKLALLQVNLVEARKLLTEAQQIADKYGLQLLASEISREHDHLLEELKLWESFKKTQASVPERLKLASIDSVMERLQGRRALEPIESSGQQPVLLLILAEGGVLLFSHPFSEKWKRDDDLFGSFLLAFSAFSDEFFSQGLDRAKFGEDTILLHPVGSFSVCYLFRGQTYFAKQKLDKFVETIQENPAIWQTLEKYEKASQVAELRDLPKMESIITALFLS